MMTVDEHYAGLNAASSEIRRAVDAAYAAMLADIRSGMSARKAAAKAFASFSGELKDVLRQGLSERMGYPVSDAALSVYQIGNVKLSTRLYQQAMATGVIAQSIVKAEARGWQDARRLALNLYEGYVFRDKEALRVKQPLPKYLRDAVDDAAAAWAKVGSNELGALLDDAVVGPSLARELAKMQAATLKTPALKAAYMQVLQGMEDGVGQDRLQKLLKTAWHERNRYFANRIAQTELHRAYTTAQARDIMGDDEVQAVQIRMSSSHPRTDICDYFSKVDLYGLGPGVYPKDKAPTPPFHPHCLPGDALITSCGRITAVSKRWYDGDMVVVTTASGKRLTATINHPILTRRGWVGAGLLDIRDDVVTSLDRIPVRWGRGLVNDQHQHMPTSIAEIFDAFMRSGEVSSREVPVASEDFHGDGMTGQVAIIGAYGELRNGVNKAALQVGAHHLLDPASPRLRGLLCDCVPDLGGKRFFCAPYGVVCGRCKSRPLARGEFGHAQLACLAPVADVDAMLGERFGHSATLNPVFLCDSQAGHPFSVVPDNSALHVLGDGLSLLHGGGANFAPGPQTNASVDELAFDPRSGDFELSRDILNGSTGEIFFDAVVGINIFAWSGHVYNLETDNGFYTCSNIITHNCRCTAHKMFAYQSSVPRLRHGAHGEFLRSLDASEAAKVMGSRERLHDALSGAEPMDIWNRNTDPLYRVRTVGDVAKGGGPGVDAGTGDAYDIAKSGGKHGGLCAPRRP